MSTWHPVTARDLELTSDVDWARQIGLEIGALNNPVVPPNSGNVKFVDYTTSAALREYHRDHPDRVANIVQVDVVWPGSGSLVDLLNEDMRFDYAIASHVIEHVPNVLGWVPRHLRGA